LKGDKEVVMAAVSKEGGAIKYASDALKGDKEVVMAAVSKEGGAIKYASDGLQGDMDLLTVAVGKKVVCIAAEKPPPGLYDASWSKGFVEQWGSLSSQIVVNVSGGFQMNFYPGLDQYEPVTQLEGEMWHSFRSICVNLARFPEKIDDPGLDLTTFRLEKIVGPFVNWKEEDTGSSMRWTYLGPQFEKTSEGGTMSISVNLAEL